jgi:hypothetical protein
MQLRFEDKLDASGNRVGSLAWRPSDLPEEDVHKESGESNEGEKDKQNGCYIPSLTSLSSLFTSRLSLRSISVQGPILLV